MGEVFNPPIVHWMARQWLAVDIAASHVPRLFLLWKRCGVCRRRWPCPQRRWADRGTLWRLP